MESPPLDLEALATEAWRNAYGSDLNSRHSSPESMRLEMHDEDFGSYYENASMDGTRGSSPVDLQGLDTSNDPEPTQESLSLAMATLAVTALPETGLPSAVTTPVAEEQVNENSSGVENGSISPSENGPGDAPNSATAYLHQGIPGDGISSELNYAAETQVATLKVKEKGKARVPDEKSDKSQPSTSNHGHTISRVK